MDARRGGAGLTRRELLRRGLIGAAGLALLAPDRVRGQQAVSAPQAKSVIQIWMWGGPSHLDTFDPKPEAGPDYSGPLDKPIETNVPGVFVGELLPQLAKVADKYSIIRGMTHGVNAHETASYIVQTGREPGGSVYPSAGAVVSLFKGYDHGYEGLIPPYIVLTKSQGRFSEAGFLGARYKPFATGGDPNQRVFAVEGIVAEGVMPERQKARRDLMHALDSLGAAMPGEKLFQRLDGCEARAYDLILGQGGKVFDPAEESPEMRDWYGRNTFGQSCLVARRLVERGVPYVTINYEGWDTHKRHFETIRQKLPQMDQGMAALIGDLSERGLLESTIVWWGGEFGRTPHVQWEEPWNGGRGHYGNCFSTVVAGGGFRGGLVVGKSDATGSEVVERPVHPSEVIRSIYTLLGIDPEGPMPMRGAEGGALLPVPAGVAGSGLLAELM